MKDKVKFSDFERLDIRIGTVVSAEVPKWSHWVMRLTVDFGPSFAKATEGKRKKTVFAGIMKFYKPEDLVGKQFPFIVNMEPKKIGPEGDYSEAMILAASVPDKSGKEEDERPVLLSVSEKVSNGTRVR